MGKPAFTVLSDAVSGTDVAGLRVELGGDAVFLNAEDEHVGPRGHRPPGRTARPARRLRHPGLGRHPDRPLDRRGRCRHRRHHADGRSHGRVGLSHSGRRPRRARCRRRLRAVRRRPVPGEPCRRAGEPQSPGQRDGHVRGVSGLCRRHRRHRHRGTRHHRRRGPDLDRPGHLAHGVLSGRRSHHAAARPAERPRRPDRHRPPRAHPPPGRGGGGHHLVALRAPRLRSPLAVPAGLGRRAPRPRGPGSVDADRVPRRWRRTRRDHPPAGVRPPQRGLRHRHQRPAAGRRRPRRTGRRGRRGLGAGRRHCRRSRHHLGQRPADLCRW